MTNIKSTIKEPRFHATCNHCKMMFLIHTMSDLYKHLEDHQIGIHFSDVKIITKLVKEYECETCGDEFDESDELEKHIEREHDDDRYL